MADTLCRGDMVPINDETFKMTFNEWKVCPGTIKV